MTKWATIVNWDWEEPIWHVLAVISFDDSQLSVVENVHYVRIGHFTVVYSVGGKVADRYGYSGHVDFEKEFMFGSRRAAERNSVTRVFEELR